MNPDSYAITTSQLLSDLSRSYTCLQDTRASLATDTANDASLVGNHPGSPEYHSDIGNLASLHLNDSNSSPRPSQGPLQRRASYSAFQHVCFDSCCDGRVFSSASNLRRHQRERSRQAHLSTCPFCNRSFYRRWTRDQHVLRLSCRRQWRSRQSLANTSVDDLRSQSR